MLFKEGDKVMVKGLDMAFVVCCYMRDGLVKLRIEGETANYLIFARPDVLLLNNTENCRAEGWL